jgi:hypothetical protein
LNINAKNEGIRSVVGPSNILLKSPIQYLTGLYDFVKNKDIMSKQIDAFESIDEVERITNTMGLQSFEEFSERWENHCDWFKNIIRKVSRSLTNRINNDLQRPYFIVNLFLVYFSRNY